ncbi:MAG TPA: hypothetical protein VED59_04060, partial [Acidimicrobiales bacterium]|nr:hypothetical protein [Acidimicrobiales bacterium]
MPFDWFSWGFRRARLQKARRVREHNRFAYIPRFLQGSSQNMAKVKKSPAKEVNKESVEIEPTAAKFSSKTPSG